MKKYSNYNQSASDIRIFWIIVIVFVIVATFAVADALHGDEFVHVNLKGWYDVDSIVVTDSYGNLFEPSGKQFDLIIPSDPEYMIQIDIFTSTPVQSFEPFYSIGSYVVAPEFERKLSPDHIRVVMFVGLLQSRVEYNYLERGAKARLRGMVEEDGSIGTVILSPHYEEGEYEERYSGEPSKARM